MGANAEPEKREHEKEPTKKMRKKEKVAEGLVAARETLRRVLLYSPNCLHNLFSEGRQIVYPKYSFNGKSAALVSMLARKHFLSNIHFVAEFQKV